jgi:hypothetical protein
MYKKGSKNGMKKSNQKRPPKTKPGVNISRLQEKVNDLLPELTELPEKIEIKTSKCDNVESLRRKNIVINMLLQAYTSIDIIQYCLKEFNVGEGQARKYIMMARKIIEDKFDKDITNSINWFLGAQKSLFNKCIQEGDNSTASRMLEQMAKSRKFDAQIGTAENPVHVIQIVRPEGGEPEKESK